MDESDIPRLIAPTGNAMALDIKTLNHNQLNDLIERAKQRQTDLASENSPRSATRSTP